jgi:hypothetical protein
MTLKEFLNRIYPHGIAYSNEKIADIIWAKFPIFKELDEHDLLYMTDFDAVDLSHFLKEITLAQSKDIIGDF